MPRLQLTAGAYQTRSVIASAQRCLNLFGEPMPMGNQLQGTTGAGEPASWAFYPTPGLRRLCALPQGRVRGVWQATTGGVYAVAGTGVYRLHTNDWSSTHIGDVTPGIIRPVGMADNGLELVIVDGSPNGWTVNLADDTFAQITEDAFYGADRAAFLDTYLLFNKPGTPQFYASDSLATTFDPLYFADKESFSDELISIAVAKREIWLLGSKTTEVWTNTGQADFPFAEQGGVFVDTGCAAVHSVATHANAVYWLGRDRNGQGVVMRGIDYAGTRISTFPIENVIAQYAASARIDDAIGFVYQLGGHAVYVLTFPHADATWAFDITTGQWHEWRWIDDNGEEHRHRANCCCAVDGVPVVGDWQNGNVYALDRDVFTDDGQPIKRERAFPHILNDGNRAFYHRFIADIETGTETATPVATRIERTFTWLPEIASLVGPPATTNMLVLPDWRNGYVYFVNNLSYSKYTTDIQTQSAAINSASYNGWAFAGAVDPQTGNLIVQRTPNGGVIENADPIDKLDQNTFAVLDTFGTHGISPSYPTSVWGGEALVCIVCNGVTYALLKEYGFSGAVAAIRVDTMEQAGFHQTIISGGSIDNRGIMCAGASGGITATAFVTWRALQYSATVPLHVITITAGAETYDPASWPATNSHIVAVLAGNIAASAIDPTQTNMACFSIGYDLADGNVLMHIGVGTATGGSGPANFFYIAKIRATDAAVLWTVQVSNLVHVDFEHSRINGTLWVYEGTTASVAHTSWRIDTLTGRAMTQPFTGAFGNIPGYPIFDSQNTLMLFWGDYTAGADNPIAVDGTAPFSNGWAIMGGQTVREIVETAPTQQCQISLEWSNDRGHSWSNPVSQPMGTTGQYGKVLTWQRLGMARDRCFRLRWSCPAATALQGSWIEISAEGKGQG